MKHTKKKRVLALVLCMVLVLSTGIAAFANENVGLQSVACSAKTLERVIKNANGEQIGTLTADVPEGAFFAGSSDANIQMEIEPDTGEAGVLNRVQQQMEAEGVTGYTINNYVMGDVTFYVNGEKQTPQQPITFHVSGTNIDTQNVMAFADDRQNTPTLMDATTDENGGLQFTAQTSGAETIVYGIYDVTAAEADDTADDVAVQAASDGVAVQAANYTIITNQPNGVNITVQHYLDGGTTPLYKDSTIHLTTNEKIENNLGILTNYDVVKVVEVVKGEDGSEIDGNEIGGTITLTENKTYRVYYSKKSGTVTGDVQMFDYYVNKGNEETSINSSKNYSTESTSDTRFASGTTDQNQYASTYDTFRMINGQKYYINAWDKMSTGTDVNGKGSTGGVFGSRTNDNAFPATGIINGINYKTGALSMGMGGTNNSKQLYEPGFFTNANEPGKAGARIGKNILSGYQMVFSQEGDTYKMQKVTQNGNDVTNGTAGSNFFPLDDITNRADSSNYEDGKGNNTKHNDFFGMRYDISFTLGDYLGDLNYSFTGDDDLWVVLDAAKDGSNTGKVILDLGGIHTALKGNVDLWEVLLGHKNYTTQEKLDYLKSGDNAKKEHTLTVLYMERGANVSNCDMSFTLPNSKIIETTDIVKSDLELTKVNTSEVGIEGAVFELVNDGNASDKQTLTSDENGKITFASLREGNTYTLTEKSVPSPYVKATTEWKVKMEGNPLKAVLYNSTGTTAETLDTDGTYHIVNDSQGDIVSKSVESNKTVSVKDYDNRIYRVDLTASSKATQTVTKTVPYDIILVLDKSGSMEYEFYDYTVYNGALQSGDQWNRVEYFVKTDDKIYQKLEYHNASRWDNSSYWYYKDANSNTVKVTQGTTTIYTRSSNNNSTKMAVLKSAAKAFVENVNTKNPDSRISVVSFGRTNETEIKESSGKYLLRVGDSKSTIDNWIDSLNTGGATDTATGFRKANTVFSSSNKWADVQQTDGRKKMVVFLTDGVPTTKSSYNSSVAGDAVDYATTIKTTYGADIYSLGIFDAADSSGELSGASIATINQFMENIASDSNKYMTADSIDSLYNIFNSITDNLDVSVTATITDVIDSRFELTADQKKAFEAKNDVQVTYNNDGTTTVTWTNTTVNGKNGDTPGWHETIEIKAKDDFIGGNMIPTNGPTSGITVGDNTKLFPQPSVNVKLLDPSLDNKEITVYKNHTIKSSDFPSELANIYKFTELDGKTELKPGEAGIPTLTDAELADLKAGKTVDKDYIYPDTTDKVGIFKFEYKPITDEIKTVDANGNVLSTADAMVNHPATTVGNAVEKYELTVTFVPSTVNERKQLLPNVTEPDTTKIKDANGNDTEMPKGGLDVSSVAKNGFYTVNVWSLEKISSSSTTVDGKEVHPKLEGAIFKLQGTKVDADEKLIGVTYYGKSNSDGFVEWYTTYNPDTHAVSKPVDVNTGIEPDTYELTELVAPAGYSLSNVKWIVRTEDNKPCAINNQETDTALQAAYENTPVYELPSTGGKGIFLYTIGGMLLMGAAAWILYKNKRREVLKR